MDIDEASAPESIEQLTKRIFTELHQAILLHESGSLDGDVEAIHDMRVAVRRLRVALSNFAACVPKQVRKRLRLRSENLALALGNVRDLDVMIAVMKASLPTRSEEEKVAISALIRRLRARRRFRLRALKNYLRGEQYAAFKHKFLSERIDKEPPQPCSEPADIQLQVVEVVEEADAGDVIEEEHGQAA